MSSPTPWSLPLVVADSRPLTPDIKAISLKHVDGDPLPPFCAGAHLKVRVALGDETHAGTPVWAERAYSLINSTGPFTQYDIAVKREATGTGGSRYMHRLSVGERIDAAPPRNDFALHAAPHEAVLIAGGIGITPIWSMARACVAANQPFTLHYAARGSEQMAFRDEVSRLCGARAHLYFDGGDPARGVPLAEAIGHAQANRHIYVCGPRPLIDAAIATARALQWPADHVHFELFGIAPQSGDRACHVVLERSGKTLDVPAHQSILDAMIEAGLDPMYDCRRGECGVCALRVLSGEPDHRDYALSNDDRDQDHLMCVCVSRARGDVLVLDA